MRKLYGYVGRIVSLAGYPLFIAYFRIFPSRRVRILVIDDRGQLLLVKGWLGSQKWMLPGGGCKKGETDKAAAARELWEETGVRVRPQDFSLLKEFKDSEFGYDGSLLMATTRHHKLDALGGLAALEIIDRAWWPQKTLPERHSPLIDEALGYLRSGVK